MCTTIVFRVAPPAVVVRPVLRAFQGHAREGKPVGGLLRSLIFSFYLYILQCISIVLLLVPESIFRRPFLPALIRRGDS